MNNKVKQVLVLLFVVSTLLIMIGSVSANTDNLNENLEASITLNDDLSAVPEVDSGADKDVSNQLTISNIDEKTNGSSSLGESGSANVVSNYEDTTIYAKDSDNNIIKASNEGDDVLTDSSSFIITNTALNPYAKVGDIVTFHVFGRNVGGDFDGNPLEIGFDYNKDQLDFVSFTPGINSEAPSWYDAITHYNLGSNPNPNFDMNPNGLLVGYDCSDFRFANGFLFNFTASFRVKTPGTLKTTAYMWHDFNVKSTAQTDVADFTIINTALNPYANVGDEVKFEVYVVNNGGTYQGVDGYFLPVQVNYDTNQLEYTGVSYDTPDRYLDVRNNWWESNVQFAYNTNGAFRNGESIKFNVSFKVKTTGALNTNAFVVLYNAQGSQASVNAVNPPEFEITNVASLPISNTGDQVSFELTVKNNGDTFYPTYILGERFVGVNLWYDNNGLHYANVTSSNPDMYLTPRVNPDNNKRLVQFAYKVGDAGFAKGDSFKLNVIFNVLAHGTFETNAQITQYTQVSSRASTTSMAPMFEITNTLSNSYVNIDDNVSFEVSGKNVGGTFRDNILGVGFEYNDTQLEYQSLTPNADSEKYNLNPNPNPSFDLYENGLVVGYNSSQMFYHGDTFNFTLTFKVLQHGKFETTAFWWQGWGVRSEVKIISNDTNLLMSEIPNALTMKVGDTVFFTYVVKNEGAGYKGSDITLNIYFDADKMEYLGITEVENLNVELLEYISTHNSDNSVLGATYGSLLGADSSVGHLKLSYTPEDGFAGGESFNFDVQFNALTDGKLQANSVLEWDQSKYSTMVSAYTFAGDPSFKLTKTADNQFVNIGDFVAYEIILENNGTLQYTDNGMVIYINDWYPEGLKYYGYKINPGSDGVVPTLKIDDQQSGHVQIKYDLYENGLTEGWTPGSKLNITLFFEVVKEGIICNFVFSEWNTSDVSSVVSGEPEINLTKKCLNSTVDVGDLVYYEIYLENTGDFDYFDHATGGVAGTNYFIIEDIYPDGLEYVGYIPNPDKNGNIWKDNFEFVGKDGDNRVIIKYKIWDQRWRPGDSLNVTLIFNATQIGKLTNQANFYWLWDDTITGSGTSINLTEEADVVVGPPTFSIDKISNYQEAKVGDVVSFSIVYSNTGNRTITGAYITDNTYSQGLEYYDFSDKELWTFDGKDTWYYNGKIGVGESATLELFFKALTAGRKSNTATAGHNINNETLEDTDTVLIREGVNGTAETEGSGVSPIEPIDDQDEKPEKELEKEHKKHDNESDTVKVKDSVVAAKNTLHETGNPLFVLLLSLLTLCFVQRKGKK